MKLKLKIFAASVFLIVTLNVQYVLAADKKISFEAESQFPPFSYVENGDLSGFQIDLSKLLFAPKDYSVEYTPVLWEQAYNDVKSGKADTCGLTVIDDSRKKDVLFTKPILQIHVAIYVKKDTSSVTLKNLNQYSGEIGVVKGNFTESLLKEKTSITDYRVYPDDESALNALQSGNIKILLSARSPLTIL